LWHERCTGSDRVQEAQDEFRDALRILHLLRNEIHVLRGDSVVHHAVIGRGTRDRSCIPAGARLRATTWMSCDGQRRTRWRGVDPSFPFRSSTVRAAIDLSVWYSNDSPMRATACVGVARLSNLVLRSIVKSLTAPVCQSTCTRVIVRGTSTRLE